MKDRTVKIIRWIARIASILIIILGLPFYFGYGNPIPFSTPNYTFLDNLWLTIFPLMFIGLLIGWKNEKVGGLLVTIPVFIGLLASLILQGQIVNLMLVPLIIGMLYLTTYYRK
ncbi:MAG TPA: hypothetical protein VJ907_05365 [Halanaerobiales bacterium]|nr:hypothetical protein [Halanaerobiales bacterium]